jgi:predicted P-loop ATPase
VFKELTSQEVDQVWAEAVSLHKNGENIYLSPEMEKVALEMQKTHTEEHPWSGIIQLYLDTKLPDDWSKKQRYERLTFLQDDELRAEGTQYRDRVCVHEIWIEALNRRDTIDEKSSNIIRSIMRNTPGLDRGAKTYEIWTVRTSKKRLFQDRTTGAIDRRNPVTNRLQIGKNGYKFESMRKIELDIKLIQVTKVTSL